MINQSVCLFHNGNSRVIKLYREKFADLEFCGNWAEAVDKPATGCLWEVCFADTTLDNLLSAYANGVKILRHISTYQDDMDHLLPECERFDYDHWLEYIVTNNLSLANEVVSELTVDLAKWDTTVIITTGRTANMHLQEVYKSQGKAAFESSKQLDPAFFEARDSVLLWRLNQWACLTSTWIAQQTEYTKSHQLEDRPVVEFSKVAPIDLEWVKTEWFNLCRLTLDQAMLSKYVCNRPTSHATTEFVTTNFETPQKPLPYRKQDVIPNHDDVQSWYKNSDIAKYLDIVYNNVITHLTPWSLQ